MKMSVDEAIKYYENKNVVLTEEEALANTIAIEIMRKYKKIEFILNWREYDVDPNYHTNRDMIDEIRKVIENHENSNTNQNCDFDS